MFDLNKIETVIWDWNGTLLNDAELCVSCMNMVLSNRSMKQISIEEYRRFFTFPVKQYYKAIGFDFKKESFEVPAMEFINQYYSQISKANLHPEVFDILNYFKDSGVTQLVLSAMEHDNLLNSLTSKGIFDFFHDISGINDHYAHSKLEMGRDLLKKSGVKTDTAIMIGDTAHDLEVARGLGIECILVSNGHQSKERLLSETPHVFSSLSDLMRLL